MNGEKSIESWIARETDWAWKYMVERFRSTDPTSNANWTRGIMGCITSVDNALKTK